MDIQMPVMDGFEATKSIREIDKDIPVVALTANAMKEDIEATKRVGMNEHLNKPIEVDALHSTLLKFVSKKSDIAKVKVVNQDIDLPEFETIDTNLGLKHMDNNKELYLKILNNFYNDYKELNLDNLNDEEFKRVVHTLKGLSANIGAVRLNEVATKLNKTQNKELLKNLYLELNLVIKELEKLKELNKEDSRDKPKIDREKLNEYIKEIKDFANRKRAKNIKTILQKIDAFLLETKDKEIVDKIKELLDKRDYNEIGKVEI
jgi:CheY-like chemotaxis protein